MDKRDLCKAVLNLRCTEVTQWEAGFVDGFLRGAEFAEGKKTRMPGRFWDALREKAESRKAA